MEFDIASFNWFAVLASVVAGQVTSTVWFVVLFGAPWAAEYGASSKQQHAKEVFRHGAPGPRPKHSTVAVSKRMNTQKIKYTGCDRQ